MAASIGGESMASGVRVQDSNTSSVTPPHTDPAKQNYARRQDARRTEQVVVLSLAIICAAIGFAFHVLWLVSIVLMVLLWAYLAADIGGSRRGGGMISDVVTSIADQFENVAKTPTITDDKPEDEESVSPILPEDQESHDAHANDEATKKELYEEARRAGIEGRSSMSKEELQEVLDDRTSS
jgi:hypothetical protein